MANRSGIADTLEYSRRLLQASIEGLHSEEQRIRESGESGFLAASACSAVKAAVVGAGLGLLGSRLTRQRTNRIPTVLACGAFAFCAHFAWRTRAVSARLASRASHEIGKVRDQHWLESNPIDYA
jgi:hypothetical protein